MNFKKVLSIAVLAIGISTTASANTGGAYVGGDFGSMDSENGWRIFGGYGINKNISFEGAYASYYDKKSSSGAEASISAFEIAGVFKNPLNEQISLFGKAGMSFWKGEVKNNGRKLYDNDGKDFFFGGGLEYDIQNNIAIRGELNMYQGDIDETRMSMGVVYKIQ